MGRNSCAAAGLLSDVTAPISGAGEPDRDEDEVDAGESSSENEPSSDEPASSKRFELRPL